MQVVEDFFCEIDRHWPRERATKLRRSDTAGGLGHAFYGSALAVIGT